MVVLCVVVCLFVFVGFPTQQREVFFWYGFLVIVFLFGSELVFVKLKEGGKVEKGFVDLFVLVKQGFFLFFFWGCVRRKEIKKRKKIMDTCHPF